jgi:K+-transporting ATPase KdpF subunit
MNSTLLMMQVSLAGGYIVGGLIAIVILAYLGYSLIKPEKF